jgi:hypothetical protein
VHVLHRRAELTLEDVGVAEDAVVREQAPGLLEGMGVLQLQAPVGRITDVGHERARLELPRLTTKVLVLVGGHHLLFDRRASVPVTADPSSVGLAAALVGERIRRLEQPERRLDRLGTAGHSEESTHPGQDATPDRDPQAPEPASVRVISSSSANVRVTFSEKAVS